MQQAVKIILPKKDTDYPEKYGHNAVGNTKSFKGETTTGYGAGLHTAGNQKKFRYNSGDVANGKMIIEEQRRFSALL